MKERNDHEREEEGLDLSEMINEYENDNALRNKIEALKKEKELQEAKAREEAYQKKLEEEKASMHTALHPVHPKEEPVSASIAEDDIQDSIEKTMAAGEVPVQKEPQDYDKTLVIMNNEKRKDFAKESDAFYGASFENKTESAVEPTVYDLEDDEIDEDDVEEYLPKDVKKRQKKPVDINKMNKIITYVISGVVVICLIALGFFAWNMWKPSDTDEKKEEEKTEETTKKEETDTSNHQQTTNNNTTPAEDNSRRIAELNGQIASKNNELNDANVQLGTAMGNASTAAQFLSKAQEEYSKAETDYNDAVQKMNEAETKMKNNTDKTQETALKTAYETAKKNAESAKAIMDTASKTVSQRDTEKQTADNAVTEKQNTVNSLQNDINNLQAELNGLQ